MGRTPEALRSAASIVHLVTYVVSAVSYVCGEGAKDGLSDP